MRIPTWTEDELVLAGALVVRNGWRELRTTDRAVHKLSELLRSLPIHRPEARALPSFRSPDSVSPVSRQRQSQDGRLHDESQLALWQGDTMREAHPSHD